MDKLNDRTDPKTKQQHDLGLDISTSVVGVCLLDASGDLVFLDCIKLTSIKFETIWDKADEVNAVLSVMMFNKNVRRIFVEENAKRFAVGYSSADTILTLAKFNGIVSYLAQKAFSAPVIDINVNSARSKL